ncbi:RidA family protein [Pontibacter sp. H249]|uniref:RidA family protein n=1 Tax=Pontibacter sp. H249 TaxID=3133420 RepID=UPI0030BA4B2C
MKRQNISSGAVWEDIVGYSRAVRVGNTIEVAGTTATNGDEVVGKGNPYEQAKYALQKIEKALAQAGASLSNVVRTRIYVTNISQWEEVGRAHGEFFKSIKPASTMVEVSALINPDLLVEIEATAILYADEKLINENATPYDEV